MLESLRNKVLAFEAEVSSSLSILPIMEKEMNSVCEQRTSWIDQVSGIDEIEAVTFKHQVDTLRKRCSCISIEIQMDALRLNGFYEAQQLQQLVVATRPRDEGETDKDREKEIKAMIKEGMVNIGRAVKESLKLREELLNEMDTMTRQLVTLKHEYRDKKRLRLDVMIQRINEYSEHLGETHKTSQSTLKRVTNDYLIVRHNARVAKEILVRSQNEAAKVRQMLEDNVDRLMRESVAHRSYIFHNCTLL